MKVLVILSLLSCVKKENEILELEEIYISYYPSSRNFDTDSIKIKWIDSLYRGKLEAIVVDFKDTTRFKSQILVPKNDILFANSTWNGSNKPFWWDDPWVNNFQVSIDSVRRYLKNHIVKYNTFYIYSKELGKQRVLFSDTSKIYLEELYGGDDLVD